MSLGNESCGLALRGLTLGKRVGLILAALLVLAMPGLAEEPRLEFRASDKSFTLTTLEDFRVTYNPHAVLSLASLDEVAVVVTKGKAESTVEKLYDSVVRSLPKDAPCLGRMMITVDGQQAAAFVIENMFPPNGEATHQTLLTVALHDGNEYNFMIHYPLDNEKKGLEDAYATMSTVKWAAPAPPATEAPGKPTEPPSKATSPKTTASPAKPTPQTPR